MKKITTLLCLGIISLGACAQPQGKPSAEDRAKNQTERLKKELSLNSDQEKKVYNLYIESGKKMEENRKSDKEDRDAMHAKMEKMRKDENDKLKTILTPEQFTKYQELQKKMDEERKERGGKGPGGEKPE